MKKIFLAGLLTAVAVVGLALPAVAQNVPDVRNLRPFTPETRYMSLEGYLRWQLYMETSAWITYREAIALVNTQMGGVASLR